MVTRNICSWNLNAPFFTFFTTALIHFPQRKLNYNVASTILALDSSLESSRVESGYFVKIKVKNISSEKSFFHVVKHNYLC